MAIQEKIDDIESELKKVLEKRDELSDELNKLTTIAVKLQGASEILESMVEESKQKEEEKSD
jgi:uncharacterized protein (DUF3084 family)